MILTTTGGFLSNNLAISESKREAHVPASWNTEVEKSNFKYLLQQYLKNEDNTLKLYSKKNEYVAFPSTIIPLLRNYRTH